MFFLVLMLFLISSMILVAVNRDKKSLYMLMLCAMFLLMFTGIIIYFAKTGGLTVEQRRFFFLDNRIQQKISFLNLSLPKIGYMIAVGRYIFPLLLLFLVCEYNTGASRPKYRKYRLLACLLPGISLIIYYPSIFYRLFSGNSENQKFLIFFMLGWISVYILISAVMLLK